jgi:hypothetical protein
MERMDRLKPGVHLTLKVASVMGQWVDLDILLRFYPISGKVWVGCAGANSGQARKWFMGLKRTQRSCSHADCGVWQMSVFTRAGGEGESRLTMGEAPGALKLDRICMLGLLSATTCPAGSYLTAHTSASGT